MKNRRIPKTKDETARELARDHFLLDSSVVEIFRIHSDYEGNPNEPIKLLEVTEEGSERGTVDAFLFAPDEEIAYWTVIALVTRRELGLIRLHALELPEGWSLSNAEPFKRSEFVSLEAETGT